MITRSCQRHGLLVDLAVFGHDLHMARFADVEPFASSASAAHMQALARQPLALVSTSADETHQPAYPSGCSTSGTAVSDVGAQRESVDLLYKEISLPAISRP